MDVLKRTFSVHKLKQMNDQENQIQMLQYEVELMKINFENVAKTTQLDEIKALFDNYASKHKVDDLK